MGNLNALIARPKAIPREKQIIGVKRRLSEEKDEDGTSPKAGTEKTDDPVKLYLREMGTVDLLSREGEIAIAKRIEAGQEAMISGLCESPLTFQAITIWREELLEEKIMLRDVIDLDATLEIHRNMN